MASISSEEIFESPGSSSSAPTDSARGGLLAKNDAIATLSGAGGDSIDGEPIDAQRGFEFFRGKVYLDTKQSQIYSVADAVEKRVEAPNQRLARLHQELTEFAVDLQKMVEVNPRIMPLNLNLTIFCLDEQQF